MEVTYTGHSGFLLDTGSAYFLFDYYTGIIPDMDKDKPLVVFVSPKTTLILEYSPWQTNIHIYYLY